MFCELPIVINVFLFFCKGFSIGSNIWLSQWSSDNETIVNGTVNTAKRDMYLGVYGALGVGQGKFLAYLMLVLIESFCMTYD